MVIIHKLLNIIDGVTKADFDLPTLKPNALKIDFSSDISIKPVFNEAKPPLPFAASEVFNARIIHSKRLSAKGDCKAIYEVTFDVKDSNFEFKAGDTIGIIPHNNESDVNFLISHLGLTSQADLCFTLNIDSSGKGGKIPAHIPKESTVRHVLTHCLDLRSIVKKLFLLALSKYTTDDKEKRTLEYLCSKEGSASYTSDVLNKGLCLLDICSIFTLCKPPIEIILANLPRLLPRPYSIVNSGLNNNKTMKICFSVITVNNRKGLTTGWIENIILNKELNLNEQMKNLNLENDDIIPIYLRKNMSMFSLPEDGKIPLILIGPGTGVAPFIGFLEEREYLKKNNPDLNFGDIWLFFGCRNPNLDYIYKDECNGYLSTGVLSKLSTAFSRIDNEGVNYIQDALTSNLKDIMKLINDGAIVYVCGDLKTMVGEVKDIFIKGFEEYNSLISAEAKAKLTEMQTNRRFIVDTWS